MKNILMCVFMASLCFQAKAEGIANHFYVESVRVDTSGYGFVGFDTALTGTPASCMASHPNHLSFDTNDAAGRSIMSLVLSAKAMGKKIYAKGTGTCDHYNIVETWKSGLIVE